MAGEQGRTSGKGSVRAKYPTRSPAVEETGSSP